jgi:hypothetical protein
MQTDQTLAAPVLTQRAAHCLDCLLQQKAEQQKEQQATTDQL